MDLNPVAVELAEVSLWLNAMYASDPPSLDGRGRGEGETPPIIPWFGNQLVCGNSLIGARRQVFAAELLEENRRGQKTWLDVVPERIPLGQTRPKKTIYHFLLPDAGMANYTDKVVRGMAKNETDKIKAWRKDFIKPFSAGEIETLIRLSAAADKLWLRHVEQSRKVREMTREAYRFFGYDDGNIYQYRLTTKEKDDLYSREILSENAEHASPFRRLKLVMDYWCALWFWPIQEADKLPSRDEFLMDLSLILEGTVYEAKPATGEQLTLLPDKQPKQTEMDYTNEFGFVNVDALCDKDEGIKRLALVREQSAQHHFHHWELAFADLFADHGGFDLNVGNPPWIKVEWNEGGILGDYDPLFVIRNTSATQMSKLREKAIEMRGSRDAYLDEYITFDGMQNFLNAHQNYSILEGSKANLYKCFLPQAWYIGSVQGITGFLHPEGVYDDPYGGLFRQEIYPRLKFHFQFQNELKLFGDVGHVIKFSINIQTTIKSKNVKFSHISNLYTVSTIDGCFNFNSSITYSGVKDENNQWNITGHPDRIICIDESILDMFKNLYDEVATPTLQARLPIVHVNKIVNVLNKITLHEKKFNSIKKFYFSTQHWNETNAQQDGTIKAGNQFARKAEELILCGPHFYIANPLYKNPRSENKTRFDYDVVDLTEVPDDYLPRTTYIISCDDMTYQNRTPNVTWGKNTKSNEFYRLALRAMFQTHSERSLVSTIIPKKVAHINSCRSYCFSPTNTITLVKFGAFTFSLPFDFAIRSSGRTNVHQMLDEFPLVAKSENDVRIICNALMLNCLTTHYAELWEECWDENFKKELWTKEDARLENGKFANLTSKWQRNCALRTDYERRQALVEIDVLVAMALGLTLDELCTIYRIQFPVLRQNENDTWYDQNGRIVFTVSKGLPGVGFSRPEWNDIKDMKSGAVSRTITDDTLPGGPVERTLTYTAPFDRCNREADYATAWAAFEQRGLK